jgi:hypothetical protein
MFKPRLFRLFFPAFLALTVPAFAQLAPDAPTTQSDGSPSTQPENLKPGLLGPKFTSHVHGIEFCPPANSTQIDTAAPDTVVEFDRDDYDWRLKVVSVTLEKSLPLSIHKDQYGNPQDGVMEITLANIKQQTPNAQVIRNEVINVGRVRVGMLAVRYENAAHDRRYTQQAIVEAPNAENKFYYIFDFTGPGKPQMEPEDIINPAEKLAYDTFNQVIDSVRLLDRTNVVEFQNEGLYATRNLFVIWNGDHSKMLRSAVVPDQYQRIIKDGQDIGYQHIVEIYEPNLKTPEESLIKVGIRSRMVPSPLRTWDTETWMYSSADRKHEHWKTAGQCTDNHGKIVDSFSQIGVSDEQVKPVVIQPKENTDGSLMPKSDDTPANPFGPERQGNIEVDTLRPLQVTTVHRSAQLNPFNLNVPVFYLPQALSYMLPRIVPLRPNHYMFAVFVPNPPDTTSASNVGNVMPRYVEVLPVHTVNFRGQTFDAIPITDKVGLDGPVTTYYISAKGEFLGSTSTYTEGSKPTTIDIIPTDVDTLNHIWTRPDLTSPTEPAAAPTGGGVPAPVLPAPPQ